jgi:putative transposase
LNRANRRATLFRNAKEYQSFINVVRESLLLMPIRIMAYCLMPNHWHFVLWPEQDDELSEFMHQVTTTHVRRWHGYRGSDGEGHVYQGPFKSFPVQSDEHFYTVCRYVERNAVRAGFVDRVEDWQWGSVWAREHPAHTSSLPLAEWPVPYPTDWAEWVNRPLTEAELAAVRDCSQRGRPYGAKRWQRATAGQLGLQPTLRSRGRPRKIVRQTL